MTHAELRQYLMENYPKSRLEVLSEEKMDDLLVRHPELPADYIQFLLEVAWGTIGDMDYSVYSAPVEPSFVFDPGTAESLVNVVLIGDDFAGVQEAFRLESGGFVFGSVDSLDGCFEPANETFSEFIQSLFVTT
ncbi:hypothetical protein [Comamonas sp.]|uniref:hypothetical protein n=1 Tax=Comamonas sp. TaxID=34028 RepID=UPI00289D3B75|nr:hypothetical protein [Comamonas sp.]